MKTISFYKILKIISYIWSCISLIFLIYMLIGHAFGEEVQIFHSKKELIVFLFFPLGIILGLMAGFKSNITGGIISTFCICVSAFCFPELMANLFFLIIVLPGILSLLLGILEIRHKIINSRF